MTTLRRMLMATKQEQPGVTENPRHRKKKFEDEKELHLVSPEHGRNGFKRKRKEMSNGARHADKRKAEPDKVRGRKKHEKEESREKSKGRDKHKHDENVSRVKESRRQENEPTKKSKKKKRHGLTEDVSVKSDSKSSVPSSELKKKEAKPAAPAEKTDITSAPVVVKRPKNHAVVDEKPEINKPEAKKVSKKVESKKVDVEKEEIKKVEEKEKVVVPEDEDAKMPATKKNKLEVKEAPKAKAAEEPVATVTKTSVEPVKVQSPPEPPAERPAEADPVVTLENEEPKVPEKAKAEPVNKSDAASAEAIVPPPMRVVETTPVPPPVKPSKQSKQDTNSDAAKIPPEPPQPPQKNGKKRKGDEVGGHEIEISRPPKRSASKNCPGTTNKTTSKKESKKDAKDWVMCERCKKWRELPSSVKPGDLPDLWYCEMNNWDPRAARCSVPEKDNKKSQGAAGGLSKKKGKSGGVEKVGTGRGRSRNSAGRPRINSIMSSNLSNKNPRATWKWVMCETCNQWRRVPPHVNLDKLPEKWYCSMNKWDPKRASCSAPQEADDSTTQAKGGAGSKTNLGNKLTGIAGANNFEAEQGKAVVSYRELLFQHRRSMKQWEGAYSRALTRRYADTSLFIPRENSRGKKKNRDTVNWISSAAMVDSLFNKLYPPERNVPAAVKDEEVLIADTTSTSDNIKSVLQPNRPVGLLKVSKPWKKAGISWSTKNDLFCTSDPSIPED